MWNYTWGSHSFLLERAALDCSCFVSFLDLHYTYQPRFHTVFQISLEVCIHIRPSVSLSSAGRLSWSPLTSSCLDWLLSFWDRSSLMFWEFPLLFYCVEACFLDFIFSSFLIHSFVLWSTLSHTSLKTGCGRLIFHVSEYVFIPCMLVVCLDR